MCDNQPKTPDPVATANAQGDANIRAATTTAALNRPDQITPWGNQTWQTDPNDPTKSTSTITLAPEQQQLLDKQNEISLGLGGAQTDALARVNASQADPNSRISVADALAKTDYGVNQARSLQGAIDANGQATVNAGAGARDNFQAMTGTAMPAVERVTDSAGIYTTPEGEIPNYVAPGGSVPTSDQAYRQQIQDALYQQQASRLDPRFAQQKSDMDAQLAAQGITQGSEAYNREVQNYNMAKNDAYSYATNQSIAGGEAAIAGQYGRDMSGRQQTVGEADLTFQNDMASRQQKVGESAQEYQLRLAKQDQDLRASQQYWQQAMGNRMQTGAEFALADTTGNNAIRNSLTAAELEGRTSAAAPTTAANYSSLFDMNRTQPINELNALRTGAQVTTPQFGSGNSGATVAAAPVADSIWNAYNGQSANANSTMSGLTTLGAAAITAGV